MKRALSAITLILGLLFVVVAPTVALELPEGIEEQVSIDLNPRNPGPNTSVTITIRSFSTNLNGASFAWFVDEQLMLNERGATTFTIKTGDVGSKTEVLVRITKADGSELARVITFAPADLELFFEPLTYVPPFYEGRSVFSHQSPFRVVAVPRFIGVDGTRYSEKDLTYTWRINGRYVEGAGGLGGNVLEAKGALVSRAFDVSVEVQNPDGTTGAKETIYITPSEPELLLYENDPLYGILYNKPVNSVLDLASKKETVIYAVPYYYGVETPDSLSLIYKWAINARDVIMAQNENQLTIRIPEGENVSGSNPIYVEARNATDILQADSVQTVVEFGEI
jgi:hypothetical protein